MVYAYMYLVHRWRLGLMAASLTASFSFSTSFCCAYGLPFFSLFSKDTVKYLLEKGSKLEATCDNGWTPLFGAARWGELGDLCHRSFYPHCI